MTLRTIRAPSGRRNYRHIAVFVICHLWNDDDDDVDDDCDLGCKGDRIRIITAVTSHMASLLIPGSSLE